jgi:hypothetical protein
VVSFNIIALGKKQILRECNETNIEDDISKVILLRSGFLKKMITRIILSFYYDLYPIKSLSSCASNI